MSKEMLKNLIELVPENDIDVLYRVIVKFIPEENLNRMREKLFQMEEMTEFKTAPYHMTLLIGLKNTSQHLAL